MREDSVAMYACKRTSYKVTPNIQRCPKRGWRTDGGWHEGVLRIPEIHASFVHLCSYAPKVRRGAQFWRWFFAVFRILFVANPFPPTPFFEPLKHGVPWELELETSKPRPKLIHQGCPEFDFACFLCRRFCTSLSVFGRMRTSSGDFFPGSLYFRPREGTGRCITNKMPNAVCQKGTSRAKTKLEKTKGCLLSRPKPRRWVRPSWIGKCRLA